MLCSRVVIAENLIFKCSSVFRIFRRRTVIRVISVLQILRVKSICATVVRRGLPGVAEILLLPLIAGNSAYTGVVLTRVPGDKHQPHRRLNEFVALFIR